MAVKHKAKENQNEAGFLAAGGDAQAVTEKEIVETKELADKFTVWIKADSKTELRLNANPATVAYAKAQGWKPKK